MNTFPSIIIYYFNAIANVTPKCQPLKKKLSDVFFYVAFLLKCYSGPILY